MARISPGPGAGDPGDPADPADPGAALSYGQSSSSGGRLGADATAPARTLHELCRGAHQADES